MVNLTLTRRGDYVVRSALALARAFPSGQPRKIREVVAEMAVPPTFASQILADLVRAGLATSKAGRAGGYSLTRAPEDISLLEVVEAGEGPVRAERCALGDGPCRWDRVCPLHDTWSAATAAFRASLAGASLADLAASDADLESGARVAPPDSHRAGGRSVALDDTVHVEMPAAALAEILPRLEARLPDALAVAYRDATPTGAPGPEDMWSPRPEEIVAMINLDRASSTGALTWECTRSSDAPDSRFEGTLEVVAVDAQRCELRCSGRLRPPPLFGETPEAPAGAMLRALLRHLARLAEDHAAARSTRAS